METTSIITVVRLDLAAQGTLSFGNDETSPVLEERHYCVDVKKCELVYIVQKHANGSKQPGSNQAEDFTRIPIKSWSMKYTKTRKADDPAETWTSRVRSFIVNGSAIVEAERQFAFLHFYLVLGTHGKIHIFGNEVVARIMSDDRLRDVLQESARSTVWLHHGLIHGSLGPMTTARYETCSITLQYCTDFIFCLEGARMKPLIFFTCMSNPRYNTVFRRI